MCFNKKAGDGQPFYCFKNKMYIYSVRLFKTDEFRILHANARDLSIAKVYTSKTKLYAAGFCFPVFAQHTYT